MFYHLTLKKELEIPPRHFGPKLRSVIEEKLKSEVEGTCSGQYGYLICVTHVVGIGKGWIRPGVGSANFTIHYNCVVFRPFKGEVIDAVVTSVNKVGFFAEAGPLQLFVSNHLIPEDYEFKGLPEPSFMSSDESVKIATGTEVRVRVVGSRMDATNIFCVATIKDDFLGALVASS
eukprot:jgi/Botrbrau1/4063/Bobra.152_3s0019.1